MSVPSSLILKANSLAGYFGFWPDFRDFEILRLKLDRSGPFIAMHIYGFHVSKKSEEKGNPKKVNECVFILRFNHISGMVLENFNQQNLLSAMTFEETEGLLKTTMVTSSGLKGYIISKTVEVGKIEPYEARTE